MDSGPGPFGPSRNDRRKPLESEFGWARADIALAYTLMSVGAALGGIVCGGFADRVDTHPIVAFGAAVMAAGFVVLSRQDDVAAIQNIYLAIGVFGFACRNHECTQRLTASYCDHFWRETGAPRGPSPGLRGC